MPASLKCGDADGLTALKTLPDSPSTPELNLRMGESEPFALSEKLKAEVPF